MCVFLTLFVLSDHCWLTIKACKQDSTDASFLQIHTVSFPALTWILYNSLLCLVRSYINVIENERQMEISNVFSLDWLGWNVNRDGQALTLRVWGRGRVWNQPRTELCFTVFHCRGHGVWFCTGAMDGWEYLSWPGATPMDFSVVLISCSEPSVPCIHNRMNQSGTEAQTQMNDMRGVSLPTWAHKQHAHAHQPVFSSQLHSLNHEVVKLTVQLQLCYIDIPLSPLMYRRVVLLT